MCACVVWGDHMGHREDKTRGSQKPVARKSGPSRDKRSWEGGRELGENLLIACLVGASQGPLPGSFMLGGQDQLGGFLLLLLGLECGTRGWD